MSAKRPVSSGIAGKSKKQTHPSYNPCFQLLTGIFERISVKFGSIALFSGVGAEFKSEVAGGTWGQTQTDPLKVTSLQSVR
jgi:hypothetical protein